MSSLYFPPHLSLSLSQTTPLLSPAKLVFPPNPHTTHANTSIVLSVLFRPKNATVYPAHMSDRTYLPRPPLSPLFILRSTPPLSSHIAWTSGRILPFHLSRYFHSLQRWNTNKHGIFILCRDGTQTNTVFSFSAEMEHKQTLS